MFYLQNWNVLYGVDQRAGCEIRPVTRARCHGGAPDDILIATLLMVRIAAPLLSHCCLPCKFTMWTSWDQNHQFCRLYFSLLKQSTMWLENAVGVSSFQYRRSTTLSPVSFFQHQNLQDFIKTIRAPIKDIFLSFGPIWNTCGAKMAKKVPIALRERMFYILDATARMSRSSTCLHKNDFQKVLHGCNTLRSIL